MNEKDKWSKKEYESFLNKAMSKKGVSKISFSLIDSNNDEFFSLTLSKRCFKAILKKRGIK